MEKKLYEASLTGNVQVLNALLQEDQLLLDRISLTSLNETPIHIAALRGHLNFTHHLLTHNPTLSTSLDSLRRSSLHLAAAAGHVGIVEELLNVEGMKGVLNWKDQDGRTPLHLAAMNEHLEVIKVLHKASPEVVKEEKILHYCVECNRIEALKLLIELWGDDEEVGKVVDGDGNTLLHLAALHKQTQTLKILLNKSSIKANGNAVNIHGFTPLDTMDNCPRDLKAFETREILITAGIKKTNDLKPNLVASEPKSQTNISNHPKTFLSRMWNMLTKNKNTNWLEKERGNFIIAASIISLITFQAGINPPGGTYFDSSNGHSAGMSVAADVDMDTFSLFLTFNTIPLIVSMLVILILASGINLRNKFVIWVLMLGMFTVFVFLLVTYMQSISIMSPDMWVNQATAYLCLVWIVISVVFVGIYTVCFGVLLVKKFFFLIRKREILLPSKTNARVVQDTTAAIHIAQTKQNKKQNRTLTNSTPNNTAKATS